MSTVSTFNFEDLESTPGTADSAFSAVVEHVDHEFIRSVHDQWFALPLPRPQGKIMNYPASTVADSKGNHHHVVDSTPPWI